MFGWLRFWKHFSQPPRKQPTAQPKPAPPPVQAGGALLPPSPGRTGEAELLVRGDHWKNTAIPANEVILCTSVEQERGLSNLLNKLEDASLAVHDPVVDALVRLGPMAVSPLIERLTHKDARVRTRAAIALGRIGPPARGALTALLHASVDSLNEVRPAARKALEQIDPSWPNQEGIVGVIPVLTAKLGDGKTPVAQAAAEVLTRMGALAVPGLIAVLEDSAPGSEPRWMWAARALGWLGPEARNAVPALIRRLASEKTFVMEAILEALGRIGPATASALPPLIETLRSQWPPIRQAGCTALGRMGAAAVEAVPALIKALGDSQGPVCEAAVEALGRIGPAARPALRQMITDRVEAVRLAKEEALRQVPDLAVPVFRSELDRWDRAGRETAVRALRRIEAENPEADIEELARSSQLQEPRFSEARIEALTEIASQVVPPLVQRLGAQESTDRRKAVEALGEIGPAAHDAVLALEQALRDVNDSVRQAAVEALFRITGQFANADIRGYPFGFLGPRSS